MGRYRSIAAAMILATVGTLGLVACDTNSLSGGFRDLEGIPPQDPANISIWNNVDGFPNVVKFCVEGVAFASTTRDLNSLIRIPEWDAGCDE